MPCSDGMDHSSLRIGELSQRCDYLARIACEALSTIQSTTPSLIDDMSQETKIFWNSHQEADRIRAKREEEARGKARLAGGPSPRSWDRARTRSGTQPQSNSTSRLATCSMRQSIRSMIVLDTLPCFVSYDETIARLS
jgi:hypothetical protein